MSIFISEKEALSYDATHHGSYYGIPIWINPKTDLAFPKCLLLDPLMIIFSYIECLIRSIFNMGLCFQFTVKEEIQNDKT